MESRKRSILIALLVLAGAYFALFWFPNAVGARDLSMLYVFNGDEAAQFPHMLRMLSPGKTLAQTAYRFIAYQQYVYGFPYYLYATILGLLPVKLLAGLDSVSLDLAVLRQMVSVLPMLVAVLLLAYLQSGFNSWLSSLLVFVVLLLSPEVVQNDLWIHPESLVFLFIVLTMFFLVRDDYRFGGNFFLAALCCGLATATKLLGLFFFLAIPLYIFIAWRRKRIGAGRAALAATGFLTVMAVTFVAANPFLLWESQREFAMKIQARMHDSLTAGFIVASHPDPLGWFEVVFRVYAVPAFATLAVVGLVLGIVTGERRLLHTLIAAWALPFGLYLLWGLAVHAKHFPLPIVLPILSAAPAYFAFAKPKQYTGTLRAYLAANGWRLIAFLAGVLAVGWQLIFSLQLDIPAYLSALHRETNSPSLKFYSELEQRYLSRLPLDRQLVVFRDVTIYVPDSPRFDVHFQWGVAGYVEIQDLNPDLVLLSKQHLHDYTQPNQLESALDPEFAQAYRFYTDALNGTVSGYSVLYQDEFGVALVRTELYERFFR